MVCPQIGTAVLKGLIDNQLMVSVLNTLLTIGVPAMLRLRYSEIHWEASFPPFWVYVLGANVTVCLF